MRRGTAIGLLLTAGAAFLGGSPARGEAPTYHRDVASILQSNCQDCHRPGQVAPFALTTYEQARKRAGDLAHVTGERLMPPWPASTKVGGPFRDQRILSDADIATLKAWADAGCPEGDPKDAPAPREFAGDWPLGPPDLILTMPEPRSLSAEGDDEFRVFVLPTDFPSDRWIRAVDFKPGNRKVVHHVIAAIDSSGRARELDAKDPGPGYEAVGGFGDGVPLRGFLPIWTPGSRPRYAPEGAGYILPSKADVLIQMHYHKSGKPETDATSIGLYLSDKPLAKQVRTGFVFPEVPPLQGLKIMAKARAMAAEGKRPGLDEMLRDVLVIPPGSTEYTVKGNTRAGMMGGKPLSRDILLTAVMPHMHWLGKDFRFDAVLPDEAGTRIPLIQIDRWNFNWQGTYALVEPIRLPKGAWFEMTAHFDNSADNPANPSSPPKLVHWGEQTNDEMCIGIYDFIPLDTPKPADARPEVKAVGGQ
ncbi:ascorbate-dependent monooxygenase [Tundrisphaera sp. TA3]|uniref:ascorbate-dependent monooxygenase n=1 Tax=Tundrisphaera sp. TA3 TaxID=3435775 RepID=UPI003EB77220